jgi:hypothetical protein
MKLVVFLKAGGVGDRKDRADFLEVEAGSSFGLCESLSYPSEYIRYTLRSVHVEKKRCLCKEMGHIANISQSKTLPRSFLLRSTISLNQIPDIAKHP